ncbi:MAG TPA: LLM class flavin-dependent oxidoreductase [Polyangiales bacterium]|nr:LLM class flavin-dependent oxidoreductase [Polyangiales bacterium]
MHLFLSCAGGQSPRQRYREAIEQAVAAERLGFESVWPVEQHFDQSVSALSCPTLLLAAIAERTSRLRLGTGIVQLPLSHPLRVAEELATLDVLSGGRVEFGVGRGSNPLQYAGFGAPMAGSRERLAEGLQLIQRAWTQDHFWFAGKHYDAKDVSLSPRPVQWPHPPIRVAANTPDTARWAGESGYAAMFATNINPFPKLRNLLAIYHAARSQSGAPARRDDVTLLMPVYVAETDAQARSELEPSVRQHAQLTAALLQRAATACSSEAERTALVNLVSHVRQLDVTTVQDSMGLVGSAETCRARLAQLREDYDPGRIIAWFDIGGLVPHAQVRQSMRRFAEEVAC